MSTPEHFPHVASFPHRRAGHCGSGALRDLLEHRGLDYGAGPLSEGTVFGLGGGLAFLYVEVRDMDPPLYLVGRPADMERNIAVHLGIDLTVRDADDPDKGWAILRDELDAGRPTMVWADIKHLDYLNVRMHNTRHDVVVIGYDESAGVAFVADNDRDEIQTCSLAGLARARCSEAFPGPNSHTTFVYEWPEQLRDPRESGRAAIQNAIENMQSESGGEALAILRGASGLAGINNFAAGYKDWPQIFGPDLPAALTGLRVFIVKAGTGGAMFRSLHAQFLHDLGELLEEPALVSVGKIYDELADAWVMLAKCAEALDHESGRQVVRDIARLENDGVAAMVRLLENGL
ncbi:MAG: BtrH N-terminal domain-containing protein [Solirubrobacterales bacterium]